MVIFFVYSLHSVSSFFFKNKKAVTETFKNLDAFSFFLWAIQFIVKKGMKVELCGMKNVDLKKTLKNPGVHYFYNKKLGNGKKI